MTDYVADVESRHDGLRLDRFLAEAVPEFSRSRLKALIKAGAVQSVAGGLIIAAEDPRRGVRAGERYRISPPEPLAAVPQPEDIALDILFEDEHLLLVNKMAGMAVHPAPGSWTGTLVNALLHHCRGDLPGIGGVERPGIVHRLDKDTTGVLAVAKTEVAHRGLTALFADHDIERTYLALTRGAPRPRAGTIKGDIARSPHDRKKMAVVDDGEGRSAITHYATLEAWGEISRADPRPAAALVRCQLETGRTHQIRLHLAHVGHSLVGDPVYGRHRGIKAHGQGPAFDHATDMARRLTRQALHAASLAFRHPVTGARVSAEVPPPEDFGRVLAALRGL